MPNSFKMFSFDEDKKWYRDFNYAEKHGDRNKIITLLKKADKVYLDEYFISNTIDDMILSEEKEDVDLENLKKCKLVKDIVKQKNAISIKTDSTTIKVSRLSDIIPSFKISDNNTDNPTQKSVFRCEYISQLLSFPNSVVTGYIYGIADKAKDVTSWVEFKNNKNQEFVVFPDTNTIYNKEGFYFLKHAEPIKKISSDDIKGKGSVSKSGFSNSIGEVSDIEVDIDIDSDR